MTEKRIKLGRGFGSRLRELLESGGSFAVLSWIFSSEEEFSPGEMVEAETVSRERFLLQVRERRTYQVEEIPEEVAREAGFINGFSFQFVMRNLMIVEVTVTRFAVVRYIEYDF